MNVSGLMPNEGNRITLLQYILLIHTMQLGIGVLSLPRDLAQISGTDGWIAILIGWAGSTLVSLVIVRVMSKHPDGTIVDLLTRFFGKAVGWAGAAIYAIYMGIFACLTFQRMILLIQDWIMQQSHGYMLMLLFVVPAYMLARGGIRVLGRYAEVVVLLSFWMPFITLDLLKYTHWLNLLPVLKEGWKPVLNSVQETVFSFLGFESALFLYPYLEQKQKASLGIVVANTLTLFVYLFVTILCYAVFSPDEITVYNNTALSVLKVIEYRFLERVDIVMLTIYLLVISKTWIPALCYSAFCWNKLFAKIKPAAILVSMLVFMVALTIIWNPGWNDSVRWIKWMSYLGLFVAYLLPLCLWMLSPVMRRSEGDRR